MSSGKIVSVIFSNFEQTKHRDKSGKATKISVPSAVFGARVVDVAFLAIINKLLVKNCEFRISIKDALSIPTILETVDAFLSLKMTPPSKSINFTSKYFVLAFTVLSFITQINQKYLS